MSRSPFRIRAAALLAIAGWGAGLTEPTWALHLVQPVAVVAQPESSGAARVTPMPAPDTAPGVQASITASYLTPEEARERRVFFGRWTRADLATPAIAAKAALMRGVFDDPALNSPEADAIDRAEAALERGECAAAIELTNQHDSFRAARIRSEALEALGRFQESVEAAAPALARLSRERIADPGEAVEGARLVAHRVRLSGPPRDADGKALAGAPDFHALMQALGEVRTNIDRLYWPAALAEAELLYAKDNKPKAQEALIEVLSMNPTSARAWALMGRLAVDGFNVEQAEKIGARLGLMASPEFIPGEIEQDLDEILPETSVLGAEIVAQAMLRSIDGAEAARVLEPVIARLPRRPRTLALMAAAEAVRFKDDELERRLEDFDAQFGRSALAYFEVGKALSGARQYDAAIRHLQEASRRAPAAPEALVELGMVLVQAARDEEAQDALEKAFALDPFNTRADNSLRLVREMRTYKRIETAHFVIRYKATGEHAPAPDELLAEEMPDVLERNHEIVTGAADHGIDHQLPAGTKTYIDLMPDHAWFAVRIAGMPRIHTIAASTGPLIAMESPREGPGHTGLYDWARVLRHEYVHTITLSRSNNRIPHWFTEAAAVHLEHAPRDYTTCQMLARAVDTDSLFDFNYINLAFVRPKKPSDRSFAYAQGEWMYSFMIEAFGPSAPLALMDAYAAGQREEEAFEGVLKVSRAEFFDRFKASARTQGEGWGLLRPAGRPSITELLAKEQGEGKGEGEGEPNQGDGPSTPPAPTQAMVDRWVQTYPDHPDVLELALEMALARAGGLATPEVEPLIARYAAARPVDPKPHKLLAKMYLDAAANDPANLVSQAALAIPHLEYLDVREDKVPAYAAEIARRYGALGQFESAIRAVVRATQMSPFDASLRELAATVAIQGKRFDLAEHQLRALSRIEPSREIHARRLEALRRLRESK